MISKDSNESQWTRALSPDDDCSKRQKRERRVHFFPKAQVRKCLHHNNYSEDEIEACWFGEEELKEIIRHWQVALD
jgi:hypothetical protein